MSESRLLSEALSICYRCIHRHVCAAFLDEKATNTESIVETCEHFKEEKKSTMFQPEPLKSWEKGILERFFSKLVMDVKVEFTSDDFRAYGLDKELYGEENQKTGLLFWKAKRANLIEDTGRRQASTIQTNHFRENKVYRRSQK